MKRQDRMEYTTPDGVRYMLSSPVFILQEDGLGMPPIEWVTERGPFQHGETVKDFFLRPRTIQVILRRSGCSRAEYWNIRNALLNTFRPGRSGVTPGVLRKYLANGAVREWEVQTSQGPGFPSHDTNQWDEYSVQDVIRFTAFDPVARNPVLKSQTFVPAGSGGTFPITFPFQTVGFGSTASIVYAGTWQTYPTIVLTGPMTGPVIQNLTTGERIELATIIAAGQVVTIDLAFGRKTVTLADGTSLIGFVSSDSDLSSFHLEPGTNSILAFGTGTSGASSISLQWYERFIGI